MSFNEEKFRLILENEYDWPSHYTFKFIVPTDQVEEMKNIFKDHDPKLRPSRKGNYTSVTYQIEIKETQEVIDFYIHASKIKGCISL